MSFLDRLFPGRAVKRFLEADTKEIPVVEKDSHAKTKILNLPNGSTRS